jgi:hypothetical protein
MQTVARGSYLSRRNQTPVRFNDSDKIILFLYRMSQLESRTYVKELRKRSADSLEFPDPNVELFDAFILTFRHFYSTNEPTFIDSIHAILSKSARTSKNDEVMKALISIKEAFEKAPKYRIHIYDANPSDVHTRMTDQELFDLYINCHYFHTDARGGGLFFQLPEPHRTKCNKVFQLSLVKYINRLRSYVPLAASLLNSGLLPQGIFHTKEQGKYPFHFIFPQVSQRL